MPRSRLSSTITLDSRRTRSLTVAARRKKHPLHILITAGPTREYLDPVRYLSNASSGRMGYAVAAAAARRGHRVTLVSGPVEIAAPPGVRLVRVTTALQMLAASKRAFASADAAVFVAAVCDWRPARRTNRKLPKSKRGPALRLRPNPDIAATLGRMKGRAMNRINHRTRRRPRVTIGFALEDHDGRRRAATKLRAKRLDAIVLNSPRAVGAAVSRISIFETGGGWTDLRPASKASHAAQIIRLLERRMADNGMSRHNMRSYNNLG
jgi:phosphopantothenoylcysteine decarboxylase/phosphopantothenate--cysteine ligase